jgi:RNA polymerase sigma-70 factor (ECF subfamily)
MRDTDDQLMLRGAAGDDEAFRLLVARWERPVFVFLERMLGSREEAQDLCQETFLRLVQTAGRYRPEGKFTSLVFRIAGNLARSRLRRRRVLRWLPFESGPSDPPAADPDPQESLERTETRREIREALSRLPDRQRQALVLKLDQELSYAEIAEAMGVTVGSVQMLVHRGMTALRKVLKMKEHRP